MSWFSRLANAIHPNRLDKDLADEMADHLERRAAALREKGIDPEEARRLAQVRFGNATGVREASRGIRLWASLEGALQDIRYCWRGMRKAPVFALTAVISLALAIGANTAIYSIVDAAILRPLPVDKPEELFKLAQRGISDPGMPVAPERDSFSYPEYLQFVAVSRDVARLALFSSPRRVDARAFNPVAPFEKLTMEFVSGGAFHFLGIRPVLGHLFSSEEDRLPPGPATAVLSYDYWQRRFQGDPKILGRNLIIEGKPFEIAGVAAKGFFGVEPGKFIDVWVPGTQYLSSALTDAGFRWFRILGRAPGISPSQLRTRLQPPFHNFQVEIVKQHPMIPTAIKKQFLESTIRMHPASTGVSGFRETFSRPLWIVFGVAAVILLIGCANVASLLLARSTARAPEMAMRISLGASRIRLIRQMLTESLVLSLAAGALGWLLARVVAPLLVSFLSTQKDPVRFALAIDTRVLAFCIAVSTLAAVFFGLMPAWQASRTHAIHGLRPSTGQAGKLRLGKVFVSVQVACAFCLVTVGAAFLFSLANLLHVYPGFDAHNVAMLDIMVEDAPKPGDPIAWGIHHRDEGARLHNLMTQLKVRVVSQPGVQAAALATWPIFDGGGWSEQVVIPGKGPSQQENIFYRISPGYFATLRTPLLAGRDFAEADMGVQVPAPAIVNEAFARKYFGGLNVLGREFSYRFRNAPVREVIVGVAADAHYASLRSDVEPMVYIPIEGSVAFTMYVRSSLPLGQIMRVVSREAHAVGSGMRVREVTTLETIVGNTLLSEKLLAGLGGAFAFFGLLLAAIGLFGLLSYSVSRRTREIGIRAALGAQRRQIVLLILKDVGGLTAGGLIIGLAAALTILTALRSLLFGIQKLDPLVIGTAIGIFLLSGLAASAFPAHHAATIDPMTTLREE